MSKKSRRRNKKILAALALAGGAALMGRNKRIRATDSPGNAKAAAVKAMTSDAAYSPPTTAVTGISKPDTSGANAASKKVFLGNTRLKRDGMGPMESVIAKRKIPGYGTAVAPPGILNPYNPRTHTMRGMNRAKGGRIGAKKGGSVTGIAKRGFGRALMKGKK